MLSWTFGIELSILILWFLAVSRIPNSVDCDDFYKENRIFRKILKSKRKKNISKIKELKNGSVKS